MTERCVAGCVAESARPYWGHGRFPLMRLRATCALALLAICDARAPLGAPLGAQQAWMLGPFAKPKQVNPIIAPIPASTFRSPMNDSTVHWEEFASFNPAAVVRGGMV